MPDTTSGNSIAGTGQSRGISAVAGRGTIRLPLQVKAGPATVRFGPQFFGQTMTLFGALAAAIFAVFSTSALAQSLPMKHFRSLATLIEFSDSDSVQKCRIDKTNLQTALWLPINAFTSLKEDANSPYYLRLTVEPTHYPSLSQCVIVVRLSLRRYVFVEEVGGNWPVEFWSNGIKQNRSSSDAKSTADTVERLARNFAVEWQRQNK